MEDLREDVNEMRTTIGILMNQFMDIVENMAKGQEELRAAIQIIPAIEAPAQASGWATNPPDSSSPPTATPPTTGPVPPPIIGFVPPPGFGFVSPHGIGFTPHGNGFVPPSYILKINHLYAFLVIEKLEKLQLLNKVLILKN